MLQRLRHPAFSILLIAPFFGESLSGSTPPLDLLLPWNLALMAALYGCGALICREVARRYRLGLLGLILLGAAYGIYEEALVDRYWFFPTFWKDVGVGSYSRFWHTNVLLATHLTAFHAAVSVCASVLVVERLFPSYRDQQWVGNRGLAMAAVTLGVVVPFVYGEFNRGPGTVVLLTAAGLCVSVVGAAFLVPRLSHRRLQPPRAPRPGLGLVAFACTAAHFVLVYSLPYTGIPWPVGTTLSLAPLVGGIVAIPRMASGDAYGPDGLRVITGILAFFVLLDIAVGLGGRYDLTVGGLLTALALRRIGTRDRQEQRPRPDTEQDVRAT